MFKLSKKTAGVLAAFMAVSSTVIFTGCTDEQHTESPDDETYEDQVLKDDNGKEYTLHKNEDGTETATYKDGQSTTFRRDGDGNLNYVSGTAGLLGGLAAGYFLFHGFNSPTGGYYDAASRRYLSGGLPSRLSGDERDKKMYNYVPAGTAVNSIASQSAGGAGGGKSVSTTPASKGGFGSAGARGGAAS